jgi:hypothetical protein
MRIAATTAFAVLAATTAFAQDEAARRVATEVAARVPLEQAAKGAPYSAETVVEGSQALADGNKISTKTTGRVYRDGEGRTRREEDRKNGTVSISINDPVGGYSYSLDPVNKVAWRTSTGVSGAIMGKLEAVQAESNRRIYEEKITAEGQREVRFRSTPQSDEEKQKVEAVAAAAKARSAGAEDAPSKAAVVQPAAAGGGGRGGAVAGGFGGAGGVITRRAGPEAPLEHKTIDGVAVEGRTTRTVIPAGQVGNEQPITILNEQWRSPDLNVLVMTRHADPRTGESSYRLVNIIRAEPDPSLFMVPPDYTVKDSGIRRMIQQ